MSPLHLLKIGYYFDSNLGYDFTGFWIIATILVAVLIATIYSAIRLGKSRKHISGHFRKIWGDWNSLGYTASIIGLVYLFFRYQGIPILNWRLWPTLLIIGLAVWAYFIIRYQKVVIPKKLEDKEREAAKAKYFRARKKKSRK